jgi:hypothetical protein
MTRNKQANPECGAVGPRRTEVATKSISSLRRTYFFSKVSIFITL